MKRPPARDRRTPPRPQRGGAAGHPWRGFEQPPAGCLLEQIVDPCGRMGIAYERSLRFEKREHAHDRPLLVFPRGGTSMRVTAPGPPLQNTLVTSDEGLVVPAGLPHADHWATEVYDTFALLPEPQLVDDVAAGFGVPAGALGAWVHFRRTPWLRALLDEYFAERVMHGLRTGPRHDALETLLVAEVLRLVAPPTESSGAPLGPGPGAASSAVARAVRHLEANLFADVDVDALCRAAAMSRSSLFRHFRAELGLTPRAYQAGRRLDEARRLLRGGHYAIGDVARLVGYQNLSAFSDAFHRRFGVPPSVWRRDDAEAGPRVTTKG